MTRGDGRKVNARLRSPILGLPLGLTMECSRRLAWRPTASEVWFERGLKHLLRHKTLRFGAVASLLKLLRYPAVGRGGNKLGNGGSVATC